MSRLTLAFVLGMAFGVSLTQPEAQEPGCTTDAECSEQCPPPADDDDCDGGPEPTMYRVRYPSIIGVRG
jgi:hypothetical protein